MYSGFLRRTPFAPDPALMQYSKEREEYQKQLTKPPLIPDVPPEAEHGSGEGLRSLLDMISPEDSALVALILFLLCDNTENDVVLLGILLYVLLSK